MTIIIKDDLFTPVELSNLDLGINHFKKVDVRAPDQIVPNLWPEQIERPSSTHSFKIERGSINGETLDLAAHHISEACFPTIDWSVTNARYFHYDVGHRVVKHVDGADKLMAAILYLTPNWTAECSGELEVDFEDQTIVIPPRRGRIVAIVLIITEN